VNARCVFRREDHGRGRSQACVPGSLLRRRRLAGAGSWTLGCIAHHKHLSTRTRVSYLASQGSVWGPDPSAPTAPGSHWIHPAPPRRSLRHALRCRRLGDAL